MNYLVNLEGGGSEVFETHGNKLTLSKEEPFYKIHMSHAKKVPETRNSATGYPNPISVN